MFFLENIAIPWEEKIFTNSVARKRRNFLENILCELDNGCLLINFPKFSEKRF